VYDREIGIQYSFVYGAASFERKKKLIDVRSSSTSPQFPAAQENERNKKRGRATADAG
jgi:hypothetical protein